MEDVKGLARKGLGVERDPTTLFSHSQARNKKRVRPIGGEKERVGDEKIPTAVFCC